MLVKRDTLLPCPFLLDLLILVVPYMKKCYTLVSGSVHILQLVEQCTNLTRCFPCTYTFIEFFGGYCTILSGWLLLGIGVYCETSESHNDKSIIHILWSCLVPYKWIGYSVNYQSVVLEKTHRTFSILVSMNLCSLQRGRDLTDQHSTSGSCSHQQMLPYQIELLSH